MFDLLDAIVQRRPRSAESLFESILSLSMALSVFREPVRVGPGVRNWHKDGSKWSGADIRAMNARNGVGSSKARKARETLLAGATP